MTRLCDQLRQIYASGDSMTVLKLLKELIDAVEDFEGHTATSEQVGYLTEQVEALEPAVEANTAKHLYKHEISISFDDGSRIVEVTKCMYDNDSTPHTDYVTGGRKIQGACSGYYYQNGFISPIFALRFVGQSIYVDYPSNDGEIGGTELPSSAVTIFDTVTQIF